MNELQIRRTLEFLRSEQMLSGGWLRDSNGEYRWSYTISDRAHDLIDIDTVEDYLVLNAYAAMAMVEATVSNSTSPDPRKVFVIHGRDQEATDAVFDFLRCLDLRPLEWEDLIRLTGSGSPYTGEAVARAFTEAQAVVVVITPDDEVRLHPSLLASDDPEYESNFTGQARPNVLLEAGMALGAQPNRTIIVELGHVRPVSDLTGRNVLRLGKGSDPLNAFVERLTNAECAVNRANPSWMDATRFSSLNALTRRPHTAARAAGSPPNAAATRPPAGAPGVTARLVPRGNSHLLEVTNTGAVPLNKLSWQIQDDAPNWAIMSDVLPEYPVEHLAPNEHVRVPVSITMGGPVVVRLRVNAATPGGEECGGTFTLSIYG
jgi:predicted nucleotide-binding protein